MVSESVLQQHLAYENVPVCRLEIKPHFESLTPKEKKYAHYLSKASWEGARIVLEQISEESPIIFDLILTLFKDKNVSAVRERSIRAGVPEDQFNHFLQYCAQFLGNMGNYKSFGDTKFIPRVSVENFDKIVLQSNDPKAIELWNKCKEKVYSLESSELQLGFNDENATSTYYSKNITRDDINLVQAFLEEHNISAYNTRVFKNPDDGSLEVRLASAAAKEPQTYTYTKGDKQATIRITYGDYRDVMAKITENIKQALPFVANENQQRMLEKYVDSFYGGSIEDHKDSQRYWIKDIGPTVESNIGFIESYRDPAGVRGEWEGFVAVVNKEMSKKFESLVNNAPKFIAKLPWPKEFEKDEFKKPDFTSLEVLTFATSGVPAGINIPNYDDIRQTDGFKNVSLGNVLNAQAPNEQITFLSESDKKLFEKYRGKSFEVQVGLHELLGHGSGKLFEENENGALNFNKDSTLNPLTNKPVSSWYKKGETYPSKFKEIASAYEECKAECVGIYLSTDPEVLKLFGYEGQEAEDVMYVNWLNMVRAGVLGLEFYNPASKKWGQAHMQARYGILRVLLEAGQGLVEIDRSNGLENATVKLDRSKILSVGFPAIGEYLRKTQVYKSTADVEAGAKMFNAYTAVPDEFVRLRDVVIAKKQPRKIFVQANTTIATATATSTTNNGDDDVIIQLVEYDASPEGIIYSFVDRFQQQQQQPQQLL